MSVSYEVPREWKDGNSAHVVLEFSKERGPSQSEKSITEVPIAISRI
jgi:hypothetical protein